MFPVVVGLNYRTAPVEVRERVSIHHSKIVSSLQTLRSYPAIEGAVLLSTCNRFEIYVVTTDVEIGMRSIEQFLENLVNDKAVSIKQYLYSYTIYAAVKHLFRVVSGLDSMVLGESQILGQVGKAYELSCNAGTANKIINVTFQKALAVGKKIRTETGIDHYSTSISYIAVELAKREIRCFKGKKILILGAGEMSALTMKHLVAQGASTVMVSNRSYDKAKACAAECQGQAIPLSDIDASMEEADVVFSATSSKRLILMAKQIHDVMKKRNYRPLLMIDIAVPRDIDPAAKDIPGVILYDIDDLRSVVDQHQSAREAAALEAEKILNKEMALFKKWHNTLFVLPTINALQKRGEDIKNMLLDQSLAKLGTLSPKQEKVIRSLANSIVNQFLHVPIMNLKKVSNTPQGHLYTEIIQNTFDLDVHQDITREIKDFRNNRQKMEKAE